MSGSSVLEPQTPLLETENEAVHGYVDYKGSPGGWRSASFMLAGGSLERFAYYGVESNLISYLTGPIGESVATAAANVNTWIGVVSLVPVLGAYLADSFLGRHRSIIFTSLLYILIMSGCDTSILGMNKKSDPDTGNQVLFFVSLYLIALAQGYKPCVQAFGADQFIEKDQEKGKAKSSFFNWWICGICIGSIAAHLILHYIQDNINWAIGFGIPCLAMVLGLILFLLGNRTYFFAVKRGYEESHHGRINWGREEVDDALHNGPLASSSQGQCKEYLLILLRTLVTVCYSALLTHTHKTSDILPAADDYSTDNIARSSKRKEQKNVITLLPVWITCLTYTIAYAQASTIFLKQATTLDRSIRTNFNIPAATLKTFIPLTVMFCIPIYDKIFVPVARAITKYPTGITMLQRIGAGMGISVITMVVAALVEMKRHKTAEDYGLVDIPNATLPMSFWWLVPQYILFGFADVFIQVGMQEFFYDQVPIELRSVGLSFHFGALGIGNFLSSFLVSMIDKATSQWGRVSWFSDNLNHAHIDYFYWLLAGIGAVGLIIFVYISRFYSYQCFFFFFTSNMPPVESLIAPPPERYHRLLPLNAPFVFNFQRRMGGGQLQEMNNSFITLLSLLMSKFSFYASIFVEKEMPLPSQFRFISAVMSGSRVMESQIPFLESKNEADHGDVDDNGSPGGWRSASFMLVGGSLERFVCCKCQYMDRVASLVPVLGAYLADSFVGRYRSIIVSSILYILGLGFLSLSATIIPTLINSPRYQDMTKKSGPDTRIKVLFFVSLYLVALAQGYKPCIQAFGADQFDGRYPGQSRAKSSFFNWWLCCLCMGSTTSHLILHYIQDNINWTIGFGIPCLAMILGLYCIGDKENNRLLKDALPAADDCSIDNSVISTKAKEPRNVLRLLPVWITCLTYTIAYAQSSTLFLKQATTLDKSIGPSFDIPAATLKTFIPITIVLCIPIYDRIFIPIARRITGNPTGITTLQRIGPGMAISVINMVVAALVEMRRLKTAQDCGLVDIPNATLPMSFCWLVLQYILFGLTDVFNQVGMQEFFYDQVPTELRSVGLSFYYGAMGIGNFLSSFLVSIIDKATSQGDRESWFLDNLNHAHIDYFYWLLAGIGTVGLIFFVYLSKFYKYVEQRDDQNCSQGRLADRSIGDL
ncbi:unnamed protein product [Coffea canephora]|uniref:Major facilitator superfamily (MFS) profile domain-containing protein n=1 Tax=Coffea canephora TaxID=49390 RepID=A0A068UQC3_COFCA|nr:unnamed protein product [Coffea canephora]